MDAGLAAGCRTAGRTADFICLSDRLNNAFAVLTDLQKASTIPDLLRLIGLNFWLYYRESDYR